MRNSFSSDISAMHPAAAEDNRPASPRSLADGPASNGDDARIAGGMVAGTWPTARLLGSQF